MVVKPASKTECSCFDDRVMIVEKKRVSHLSALAILIVFCIFVGGYFFGKHVATQELLEPLDSEIFADKIYQALHTVYRPLSPLDDEETKPVDSNMEMQEAEQAAVAVTNNAESARGQQDVSLEHAEVKEGPWYVAQLFGGTLEDSQKCISRLQGLGIKTVLIKRASKNSAGTVVYWYQVVTENYKDKDRLQQLVETIKKSVKLHDINIVTVLK